MPVKIQGGKQSFKHQVGENQNSRKEKTSAVAARASALRISDSSQALTSDSTLSLCALPKASALSFRTVGDLGPEYETIISNQKPQFFFKSLEEKECTKSASMCPHIFLATSEI